jgi:hypothetical protein
MKKIVMSLLTATVLMSLPAAAAPVTREKVRETLSAEIKIDTAKAATKVEIDTATREMARLAPGADSAGLGGVLHTNLGEIPVAKIALAVAQSSKVLDDSTKVGSNHDESTKEMINAVHNANLAYAKGLSEVASRISDANSEAGQAVAKVLVQGREIASGRMDVKQAQSYTAMMEAMFDVLSGPGKKSSEQALEEGLARMGLDKAAKIKELISCK